MASPNGHGLPSAGLSSMELASGLLWRLAQENESSQLSGELQDLEQKLSTALSMVRSFRNMNSPVHHLPTEILTSIFQRLQDLSTPSSYLPQQMSPTTHAEYTTYPLEPVTLVCRRWRETALALPTLWSVIFNAEEPLILRCISRSAPAPLKVYIQYPWTGIAVDQPPNSRDLRMMENIKPHAERIKELHLIDVATSSLTTSELLQSPAPLLEALTISVGFPNFTAQPTPTMTALFANVTPNLKKVTLHGFTTWSPNLFQNLTHLTLSNQDNSQSLTMTQFVTNLSGCPLLQDLAIIRPAFVFDSTTVSPPVDFLHLRNLCLGSWLSSQHISEFLSSISLPPTIRLFIWGTRHSVDDAIAQICPFSPTLIPSMNITELRITHNPDRQLGSLDLGWGSDDTLYNVLLTPSALQIDGSFHPTRVLLAAPTTFPLATVTELWIGCQTFPEPEPSQWKAFLGAFPLLKTLVISRRSSQPIITALTVDTGDEDEEPSNSPPRAPGSIPLLCPELQTLRLYADTSRSVLRLSILAEERMRRGRPIVFLQVISALSRQSSQWARSPELVSDLMYLKRYINKVECNSRDSSVNSDWELLEDWPPKVYEWIPGERR
ncbi:hypothetical protein ONZ45_g18127 [Pleurotus djamor]|nr:hypothetical protein ONZ45_g18127 [Pleurotus djamor]